MIQGEVNQPTTAMKLIELPSQGMNIRACEREDIAPCFLDSDHAGKMMKGILRICPLDECILSFVTYEVL